MSTWCRTKVTESCLYFLLTGIIYDDAVRSNTISRLFRPVILTYFVCFSQSLEVAHAVNGLALLDASFASQIIDRQPDRLSHSCHLSSLMGSRLWFWVRLSCTGECDQKMAAKGHVKVFLDWYLREDGILTKQVSLPLSVEGTTWRTWTAKGVKPGVWVVVIRAEDSEWVCLKDQCDFVIEVKP